MRMAYGYELKKDDNYVELVEHAVEGLTVTFGVGFLVDIIPIRTHFLVIMFSHRAKYIVPCSQTRTRMVPGGELQTAR